MKKIAATFLIFTLFGMNLSADTTTCDALNTNVTTLESSVTNQQALVSKLSDDIGAMADRIGDMADKIVVTEELLSKTLLTLTGNDSLVSSVALISPLDSSNADKTTPPQITLSDAANTYLLYVSTDATFDRTKSLVIYIDSSNTLSKVWSQVAELAATNNDVVFLAVKSINNSVISSLSNGVKLTLQ